MRFEDLKQDFPKMPEEMRTMIKNEVERQLKIEQPKRRSKKTMRKTLALSLAAVMLCGLTVFAGAGLYRMQRQQTGEHGVSIQIEATEEHTEETPLVIPNVKLEVGYLPEGMMRTEQGKYSFEDNLYLGGVSMAFYRMDTGDDQFEIQHGDVLSSEEFSSNGYQGVYLEYPLLSNEISFNQRIYVAYTDIHYVMEMYVASDVSKEEALKITEGVKLVPTEDTADEDFITAWNWSDYQKSLNPVNDPEDEEWHTITSVAIEEMKNTHNIGDSFPTEEPELTVKVSDVKISDDISLLDASLIDEDWKEEVDENGKLRPATIQYIKTGDTDSLSQEISSREEPQKLVYATVEYTNTGNKMMSDVLFYGSLVRIQETGGQMQIIADEKPSGSDEWDMAVNHGLSDFREMTYYDVHGGERNNNYIKSIQPGETITVHMAWVVMEKELGWLYLNLDTYSGAWEFTDSSLQMGYVDIRQ